MAWFIAYIVTAVLFHILFSSFLPASILSSKLYTVFLLALPFLLLLIIGIILYILEKKGIIKPSPPEASSSVDIPNLKVESPTDRAPSTYVAEAQQEPLLPEPSLPRPPTIDEILCTVDQLDGPGFERWCSQMLGKVGFSDIQLTKASGDQGVDITAAKDDIRYVFQCKCYSSDLGNHPIQEVHAGKSLYHCHVGVVITNRYFTPGAKELAKVTGTLLWDRDKLASILRRILAEGSTVN